MLACTQAPVCVLQHGARLASRVGLTASQQATLVCSLHRSPAACWRTNVQCRACIHVPVHLCKAVARTVCMPSCLQLPSPAPTLYDGTALITQLPPCNGSANSSSVAGGGTSDDIGSGSSSSDGASSSGGGTSTGTIVGAVVGSVAGAAGESAS